MLFLADVYQGPNVYIQTIADKIFLYWNMVHYTDKILCICKKNPKSE